MPSPDPSPQQTDLKAPREPVGVARLLQLILKSFGATSHAEKPKPALKPLTGMTGPRLSY